MGGEKHMTVKTWCMTVAAGVAVLAIAWFWKVITPWLSAAASAAWGGVRFFFTGDMTITMAPAWWLVIALVLLIVIPCISKLREPHRPTSKSPWWVSEYTTAKSAFGYEWRWQWVRERDYENHRGWAVYKLTPFCRCEAILQPSASRMLVCPNVRCDFTHPLADKKDYWSDVMSILTKNLEREVYRRCRVGDRANSLDERRNAIEEPVPF